MTKQMYEDLVKDLGVEECVFCESCNVKMVCSYRYECDDCGGVFTTK